MDSQYPTGGLPDTRPDEEKAKDFLHDEIAGVSAPPVWREKQLSELRQFPERFQVRSFSCMAQSGEKTLGVNIAAVNGGNFPILSARAVYRNRIGYPTEGMSQPDLFRLLKLSLSPLESELQSQNLDEDIMNTDVSLTPALQASAAKNVASNYVFFTVVVDPNGVVTTPVDIDQIAQVVDQGKAVQIMVFFTDAEWWVPYPSIQSPNLTLYNGSRHHGIAVVDYLMYQGKKALLIEDSAGNNTGIGGVGRRIITEDFIKARCFGAGYPIKTILMPAKPQHTFTVPLTYGMMNNTDVSALQAILQYEGFMPTHIDNQPFAPTGNFYGMTAAALKKWQVAHNILDFQNETDPRKIRFGARSIALANSLYSIPRT